MTESKPKVADAWANEPGIMLVVRLGPGRGAVFELHESDHKPVVATIADWRVDRIQRLLEERDDTA